MLRSAVVFLGAALLAGHPHGTDPSAPRSVPIPTSPAPGTWAGIASLSMGRHYLAAAAGADGRVFASGGMDVNGALTSLVEAYDPDANSWSAVAPLPEARWGHASVRANGLIYVIGGGIGASEWTGSTRAYNPSTNAWSAVADMGAVRVALAATVAGGKIYVTGGVDGSYAVVASAEVFDPATGHWTAIAAMHHARFFHALATGPDGRVYAIGGNDGTWLPTASVEAYDPTTNQWTDVASLPETRAEVGAATGADGLIYAAGGASGDQSAMTVLQTTVAYDVKTNAWTAMPSMTQVRRAFAVTASPAGGIYALSGWDTDMYQLSSAEVYGTAASAPPAPITVTVKVKSGDNAPINRSAQGNVPVIVFSTATFDATRIDRSTVVFAGAPPLPIGDAPADLNGDGLRDVMFHFSTQALSLPDGTTQACLGGKTTDQKSFQGCDTVRLVK